MQNPAEEPSQPKPWFDRAPATDETILNLLQQFDINFPTESDCLEELYKKIENAGLIKCHYCRNKNFEKHHGRRTIWCRTCRKTTWVTGGTFFHGMRSARPWLAAIWLMEHGTILSSSRFHKLIGIAQSSALHIFKKLTAVIESHMDNAEEHCLPSGTFSEVFCKRSRETPAKEHPILEQQLTERAATIELESELESEQREEEEKNTANRTGTTQKQMRPCEKMSEREEALYDSLSSEPQNTNALSDKTGMDIKEISIALTMLELSGYAMRVAGDRYIRSLFPSTKRPIDGLIDGKNSKKARTLQPNPHEEIRTAGKVEVELFLHFIQKHFHGISRKYLQYYLAAYWCLIAQNKWCSGKLLRSCTEYGRLSASEILNYVSPLLVKYPKAV